LNWGGNLLLGHYKGSSKKVQHGGGTIGPPTILSMRPNQAKREERKGSGRHPTKRQKISTLGRRERRGDTSWWIGEQLVNIWRGLFRKIPLGFSLGRLGPVLAKKSFSWELRKVKDCAHFLGKQGKYFSVTREKAHQIACRIQSANVKGATAKSRTDRVCQKKLSRRQQQNN